MKVELSRASEYKSVNDKTESGTFTDTLEVGDIVNMLTLSSGKRFILMKTEDGHIVRAGLGEDIELLPGVKVQLEVSKKECGIVNLSIVSTYGSKKEFQGETAGSFGSIDVFSDKNLILYENKLKELCIPVTKETICLMQELIERNSPITLDEAAFLASNKFSGDEDQIKSACMVFSGDVKTENILARLFVLLDHHEMAEQSKTTEESGFRASELNLPNLKTIITQSDRKMQSINVEKVENIGYNDEYKRNNVDNTDIIEHPTSTGRDTIYIEPHDKTLLTTRNQTQSQIVEPKVQINSEYISTSTKVLEEFSNILYKVANDYKSAITGNVVNCAILFEKLFARIGRNDKDGGQRLKNAREEFYTRLMLIEEEISRSAPSSKTEILEQTHRLMDFTRILNSINQYAYFQLPVIIGEKHKIAELYLFKRKDRKNTDPESINILLALELENMGHWEALINFRKKVVTIQMKVRGEKEKAHFSENSVLLCGMLAEAGFKLVNTDIRFSREETTPMTALISLERYLNDRIGMLDYFI